MQPLQIHADTTASVLGIAVFLGALPIVSFVPHFRIFGLFYLFKYFSEKNAAGKEILRGVDLPIFPQSSQSVSHSVGTRYLSTCPPSLEAETRVERINSVRRQVKSADQLTSWPIAHSLTQRPFVLSVILTSINTALVCVVRGTLRIGDS